MESNVADWPCIPESGFLYFPTNQKIKEGSGENQWRKIFQEVPYDNYEIEHLNKLNNKLTQQNVQVHPWFDQANKLRFLQANKFKIIQTVSSIKQAISWRNLSFPLLINESLQYKLNQGSIYICGRDNQYRPIIVVQVLKIKKYEPEVVPQMLSILFQFAINEMMIEGQIQNYIILINLNGAGISDKNSIKRIISFNSSTYRGRLYMMYLLNTPMLIAAGWDAFATTFIPQSSIKKIRMSKKNQHENMWAHMSRNNIQQKYGGTKANMISHFWPPSFQLMNSVKSNLKHIQINQYNKLFSQGKLNNRKIKKSLINNSLLKNPLVSHKISAQSQYRNQKQKSSNISKISSNQSSPYKKSLMIRKQSYKQNIQQQILNVNERQNLQKISHRLNTLQNQIRPQLLKTHQEKKFELKKRGFNLFFEDPKFQTIVKKLKPIGNF